MNFDASVRNDGTGLGLILRDDEGMALEAATYFLQSTNTSLEAEAICFRWGAYINVILTLHVYFLQT